MEANLCSVMRVSAIATIPCSGLESKRTDNVREHIFESGPIDDMRRDVEVAWTAWANGVVA